MAWRRGQAYSQDLRERVLGAVGSARTVAARFGVSISYILKARQRQARTGETTTRALRSHVRRRLVDQHAAILSQVEAHQDATLDELRAWLKETHGVTVSMGLMWNTLARLGLTLKKRRCTRRSKPVPTLLKRGVNGASSNPN